MISNKSKPGALRWSEIWKLDNLRDSIMAAIRQAKKSGHHSIKDKLEDVYSEANSNYEVALGRKHEEILDQTNWKKIENGPGKGYHIGVLPLEGGDFGGKYDTHVGYIKEDLNTRTTGSKAIHTLEAIKEVVEVKIEEGTLEPNNKGNTQ